MRSPHTGVVGALGALVLAWAAPAVGAPQSPHVPAMTGEQFVRDMRPLPDSDLASIRRERAMGYMDGVMDGTVGLLWCPAGQHVGHELSYLAAEQMESLPADQLKKGAAPLIVAALAKIYPCQTKGRCRENGTAHNEHSTQSRLSRQRPQRPWTSL